MISAETLSQIVSALGQGQALAAVRSQFPGVHFTECSEDDISPRARPVAELERCALYLVAGNTAGCVALTNDPDVASGVVVAAREDEE